VARGRTEQEADRSVSAAGLSVGLAALGTSAALAARRRWLSAAALLGAGAMVVAAARGLLR